MGRFDGKVAFITGAGQGIGLGIALALATEGADIAIADVEADRAQRAADQVRRRGATVCVAVCDIRDRAQVDRAVARAVAELGSIDILVNNAIDTGSDPALAATGGRRPFIETTEQLMRLQWESGALGTFHCMQACYPHLRGRDTSIVNLASRAGTDGIAGYAAYASTKEAIRALSRVASREWGADGIRVNVICPHARTPAQQKFAEANPGIEDELIAHVPLGRLGDAELDIGGAVVMLCSPDARYVTGQTVMVNGGA
jgi:NAD(P)-dependent dehydrogenase (short-subunit alcohol dehydrogenase family)